MEIIKITAGVYAANCYIVYSKDTKEGIIVDPGGDAHVILDKIKEHELDIKYIVLTHGHGDHIGAVEELKNSLKIPILIHEEDANMIKNPEINLSSMLGMGPVSIEADQLLKDGDIIEFGDIEAKILHTPGHTRGCMCLKIGKYLISGDTLFKGSIGRTDLNGGDYDSIIESIKNKLLVLDNNLIVLPGHGEASTILEERVSNPFLI